MRQVSTSVYLPQTCHFAAVHETEARDRELKMAYLQAFLDGAYRDRTGDLRLAKRAVILDRSAVSSD